MTFDEMAIRACKKLNLPDNGYAFTVIRSIIREAYDEGVKDCLADQRALADDEKSEAPK